MCLLHVWYLAVLTVVNLGANWKHFHVKWNLRPQTEGSQITNRPTQSPSYWFPIISMYFYTFCLFSSIYWVCVACCRLMRPSESSMTWGTSSVNDSLLNGNLVSVIVAWPQLPKKKIGCHSKKVNIVEKSVAIVLCILKFYCCRKGRHRMSMVKSVHDKGQFIAMSKRPIIYSVRVWVCTGC